MRSVRRSAAAAAAITATDAAFGLSVQGAAHEDKAHVESEAPVAAVAAPKPNEEQVLEEEGKGNHERGASMLGALGAHGTLRRRGTGDALSPPSPPTTKTTRREDETSSSAAAASSSSSTMVVLAGVRVSCFASLRGRQQQEQEQEQQQGEGHRTWTDDLQLSSRATTAMPRLDADETTAAAADDDDDDAGAGKHAVALHAFSGQLEDGELSFEAGARLVVELDDIGGGWSVAYVLDRGPDSSGLVPRGYFAYVEEEESAALARGRDGDLNNDAGERVEQHDDARDGSARQSMMLTIGHSTFRLAPPPAPLRSPAAAAAAAAAGSMRATRAAAHEQKHYETAQGLFEALMQPREDIGVLALPGEEQVDAAAAMTVAEQAQPPEQDDRRSSIATSRPPSVLMHDRFSHAPMLDDSSEGVPPQQQAPEVAGANDDGDDDDDDRAARWEAAIARASRLVADSDGQDAAIVEEQHVAVEAEQDRVVPPLPSEVRRRREERSSSSRLSNVPTSRAAPTTAERRTTVLTARNSRASDRYSAGRISHASRIKLAPMSDDAVKPLEQAQRPSVISLRGLKQSQPVEASVKEVSRAGPHVARTVSGARRAKAKSPFAAVDEWIDNGGAAGAQELHHVDVRSPTSCQRTCSLITNRAVWSIVALRVATVHGRGALAREARRSRWALRVHRLQGLVVL